MNQGVVSPDSQVCHDVVRQRDGRRRFRFGGGLSATAVQVTGVAVGLEVCVGVEHRHRAAHRGGGCAPWTSGHLDRPVDGWALLCAVQRPVGLDGPGRVIAVGLALLLAAMDLGHVGQFAFAGADVAIACTWAAGVIEFDGPASATVWCRGKLGRSYRSEVAMRRSGFTETR